MEKYAKMKIPGPLDLKGETNEDSETGKALEFTALKEMYDEAINQFLDLLQRVDPSINWKLNNQFGKYQRPLSQKEYDQKPKSRSQEDITMPKWSKLPESSSELFDEESEEESYAESEASTVQIAQAPRPTTFAPLAVTALSLAGQAVLPSVVDAVGHTIAGVVAPKHKPSVDFGDKHPYLVQQYPYLPFPPLHTPYGPYQPQFGQFGNQSPVYQQGQYPQYPPTSSPWGPLPPGSPSSPYQTQNTFNQSFPGPLRAQPFLYQPQTPPGTLYNPQAPLSQAGTNRYTRETNQPQSTFQPPSPYQPQLPYQPHPPSQPPQTMPGSFQQPSAGQIPPGYQQIPQGPQATSIQPVSGAQKPSQGSNPPQTLASASYQSQTQPNQGIPSGDNKDPYQQTTPNASGFPQNPNQQEHPSQPGQQYPVSSLAGSSPSNANMIISKSPAKTSSGSPRPGFSPSPIKSNQSLEGQGSLTRPFKPQIQVGKQDSQSSPVNHEGSIGLNLSQTQPTIQTVLPPRRVSFSESSSKYGGKINRPINQQNKSKEFSKLQNEVLQSLKDVDDQVNYILRKLQ